MSTVGFITRDLTGTTRQSTFSEGSPSTLDTTQAKDISLNLSASDIDSYARRGADLHLVLADGQVLVLQNYFNQNTTGGKNLFLSEEGDFVEVILEDKAEGVLFASYEPLDISGKWSAYDDMVFLDVDRIEPVIAPLAAAPVLGGFGAAGAAGVAGVAAIAAGGGGGSGGGGNNGVITPTVDNPDATHPVGGSTTEPVHISGTGTPGATVEVNMGGETQTTTIGDDGTWAVDFPVTDLPDDGNYNTTVEIEDPDGTTHTLDGPAVVIDTTPPELEVTSGTQSTGDVVNASEQSSGTVISGSGEAGATVLVELESGASQSTTVGDDGTWSVTFNSTQITTGNYSSSMTITTTDSFGNSSSYTETLVVDTETAVNFNAVERDNIINAEEASDGVTLSGTGEAGASISVLFQGVTQTTTVADDGTWSVNYSTGQINSGTYEDSFEVTSTDLAGNVTTSTHDISVDTEISVTVNAGYAGGDNIVSDSEAKAGVTLTGSAEAGATVVVAIENGPSRTVIADDNGNWEATFGAGSLAQGEYSSIVNITATDQAGNTDTTTTTLQVDTVAGTVALSSSPIEIDNVINAVERSDGVEISGTATPNMTVTVTLGNDDLGTATTQVVADDNGNWSTLIPAADIPQGTDLLDITASITDSVGNTATATGAVGLDTQVDTLTINDNVAGDDIINASERDNGVTLTGTVEPGSTVEVYFGRGDPYSATILDDDGNWTVTIPTADIPTGTTDLDIEVHATDGAGNTDVVDHSVMIDTEVDPFTVESNQTANDIINQQELNTGFSLQGTAEANSTISVTIQSSATTTATATTTVDDNGNWSVSYDASDFPAGEYAVQATIVATDAAGNSETLHETFEIDTVFETPILDTVTIASGDVREISVDGVNGVDGTFAVNSLQGDGSVGTPGAAVATDASTTEFDFHSPIPDGTDLVVTNTDALNNTSSTLLVLEDGATTASTLDHASLGQFNIDALDLGYAASVSLTLTEDDIKALSENSDTLTIHSGDGDDTINVANATANGTRPVDGQNYNVYTVGDDGATLLVEQDITVNII